VSPSSWSHGLHSVVAVPILVAAYAGSARIARPSRARVAAFALAVALVFAVLCTPLETVAINYLLSVHLLQNVVLAEWAPGLFVLAIAPPAAHGLMQRRGARVLTHPLVALPIWLATYFAWHVPAIYDAALRRQDSLLHLEHASYFVAGVLLWSPVIHGRWNDATKAAYLFAAFVLASPLGLLLALLPHPIYGYYKHAPHLWNIGHLTDQQIAGLTMAVEQAIVFFAVFVHYLLRFLRSESIAGVYVSGSRR
jgi:putative membrane protein